MHIAIPNLVDNWALPTRAGAEASPAWRARRPGTGAASNKHREFCVNC